MTGTPPSTFAVVYGADRAWRADVERALRASGAAVRSASRPAELAKCLVDQRVRVIVAEPTDASRDEVTRALKASAAPWPEIIATSPGDTTQHIVDRAMRAENQGTSSA